MNRMILISLTLRINSMKLLMDSLINLISILRISWKLLMVSIRKNKISLIKKLSFLSA